MGKSFLGGALGGGGGGGGGALGSALGGDSILGGALGGGGGGSVRRAPTAEELAEAERKAKYAAYRRENSGNDISYDQWKVWQDTLENTQPFVPREYELKTFDQLPVAPPPTVGDPARVLNSYLERMMAESNAQSEGQTEVSKALRAAKLASTGET